jgi:murein hydrolase activator
MGPGPRMRRLMLLSLLAMAAAAAAAPAERAGTEAALKEITRKLNALERWFGEADRRRGRLQRELERRDREVATTAEAVRLATQRVAETDAELARLEAQRAELAARRAAQARLIGDHLAAAHRLAGEDFFKLVLNQESPEALDRLVRYHRYFSEARSRALANYQETLDALAANEAEVRRNAAEAAARKRELESRQASLVAERDRRRELIAELDAEAEDRAVERERLLADRKRLEDLLAEIVRRSGQFDGRGFAQSQGRLPWPVSGRVLHGFGRPRADGRMTWQGIVVAAEEGTPFRAVHRGRVVFADWLRGFGLMTIVDHGSGYMTLYGQADALSRQVGDVVDAGDVLGQVGQSGGQKQAALYFEVRHQGRARDPVAWLTRR